MSGSTPDGRGGTLRIARPDDRADIYAVCLRTGDAGGDATGKYSDDALIPDIWAGPYLTLQPDLAFVVDTGDRVSGYLLMAQDTRAFVRRYRTDWLPGLAARHPVTASTTAAEADVIRAGLNPEGMIGPDQDDYPAHLHIDLLPELQRQGWGRALMRAALAELHRRGVPGVQLAYGAGNVGAGRFYRRLGFHPLPSAQGSETLLAVETDAVI